MRRNCIAIAVAASMGLTFSARNSNANSIGLNVTGGGGTSAGEVLDAANVGVTSTYQQTHWNNFNSAQNGAAGLKNTYTTPLGDTAGGGTLAGGGAFLDNTGANVTGLTVLWAGSGSANSWTHPNGGSAYMSAPPDSGPLSGSTATANNMYDGYLYGGGGANYSVEVQNIPYSTYTIVVYGANASSVAATVSTDNGVTSFDGTTGLPIGGTSIAQGTFDSTALSSWTLSTSSAAGNYFVLTGLTGANQTITFVDTVGEFDVNAIQIVDTSAAVPEPASLSLLVLGGIGLLRRRSHGLKD